MVALSYINELAALVIEANYSVPTSVSCSLWPIRLRDSPSNCRCAATSMGSVSGTLIGEEDNTIVLVGDFLWGDSTPAKEAENRCFRYSLYSMPLNVSLT